MSAQVAPPKTQDTYKNKSYILALQRGDRLDIAARLKELDAKIQTWKKIAQKQDIDISSELSLLKTVQQPTNRSNNSKSDLSLQLEEKFKYKLCEKIVMKVRATIKPPEGTLKKLDQRLLEVTMKLFAPLSEMAREDHLDISNEMEILKAANHDALGLFKREHASPAAQEAIRRRLIFLREQACFKFMAKVYTHKIATLAEQAKSKDWFDCERSSIIEGIKQDALSRLTNRGSVFATHELSQEVFKVFQENIKLYDKDPEKYHRKADEEWFVSQLNAGAEQLKKLAKGDLRTIEKVEQLRSTALSLLGTIPLTELQQRVKQSYELFREQCGFGQIGNSCGFSQATKHCF